MVKQSNQWTVLPLIHRCGFNFTILNSISNFTHLATPATFISIDRSKTIYVHLQSNWKHALMPAIFYLHSNWVYQTLTKIPNGKPQRILKCLLEIDQHFTNAIVIMNLCEKWPIVAALKFNWESNILPMFTSTNLDTSPIVSERRFECIERD